MKVFFIHLLLLLFGLFLNCKSIQAEVATEQQIKTRYVFNFAKFSRWPSSVQGIKKLCILGPNPFDKEIETLTLENSAELRFISNIEDSYGCQVLFLNPQNNNELVTWLNYLDKKPVLTISDYIGSSTKGVMIELSTHSNRIAFKVNRKKVLESEIDIPAGILKLAEELL